jgi:hypothetical protein
MKPDHTQTLGAIVDRLGIINATIADLKKEAATLRAGLEDAGLTSIEGMLYRATIAQCAGKTATDWQTIAMRFKPSPQLIRRHTTTGAESIRLTISARKGA